ncbi:DUF6415 family natural product biosynthesis protein [Rhodococcus qingshengii]|uniref:DUF6415 family natural product biosynthesis protein n=1 Tax=Rhodococcus qingshengii TaxID=334542 RepID=UPI0036F65377
MRRSTLLVLAVAAPEKHFEGAELEGLAATFRDYIKALIPAVRARACVLPEASADRAAAMACIGEAEIRLCLGPGDTDAIRGSVTARLARSVKTLCEHYEQLAPR